MLLIIDGIDEIETSSRNLLYLQLEEAARIMTQGNVLATCRSGDFAHNLEGFDVVEILPLSDQEIAEIAKRWSKNPEDFLDAIQNIPYRSVLDRPLFLCQIILVFEETGSLPDRPSEVYRLVILLMIEKWDRERSISRNVDTAYGKMKPDRKLEVLSALSMELLYGRGRKAFSDEDLEQAFLGIYKKFRFDMADRYAIITEIESHTGIIVKSAINAYEFCHFSLQEYLCGYYLVRQHNLALAIKSFQRYREPVAIAVCLSSDASTFFGEFVMQLFAEKGETLESHAVTSFLHRLSLESPYFSENALLGGGLLTLASYFGNLSNLSVDEIRDWKAQLSDLAKDQEVMASVRAALHFYGNPEPSGDQRLRLNRKQNIVSEAKIYPVVLHLPVDYQWIFNLERTPWHPWVLQV